MSSAQEDLLGTVKSLSREVLKQHAADVDSRNRFPTESIEALRQAGLFGFFVPNLFGGIEGNYSAFCRIASILGEECLSTALIWVMHCSQVAVLADHAANTHADILTAIAHKGLLVASVTTEPKEGSDLLRVHSALVEAGAQFRVQRIAPVVSYGAEADLFLTTMRASASSPVNDVSLVLIMPQDGDVTVEGEWNAMGMRGTRSIAMKFDVFVDRDRVISKPFREVALQSMTPVAHMGWSACWFGAARGAYKRFVTLARVMGSQGRQIDSDLFLSRLARMRVSLDLMEGILTHVVDRLDVMRQANAPFAQYENSTHKILLNNLKVAVSELSFSVVNQLMELAGLRSGYLVDESLGLERVFRDLRSASLMYSNDRLLNANAKLVFMEGFS